MILVTGSVTARPETIEEIGRISLEHVNRSRLEPGCLLHSVHVDVENANRLGLEEFLQIQRGVCQDFTHLAIAVLRAAGLAGRYVSGYLLTRPAPGQMRRIGADASHAWASLFVPGGGWLDFDPTNNIYRGVEHITTAYGRDYGDVSPVRGTVVGGGPQALFLGVTVVPAGEQRQ